MLRPGFSLWLDALRALAALTVILGHFAHVRFTRGDYYFLREINIASDAVVVFFVLSGLVIAFAAERDGSFQRFAFNRLTRLWTVILPALVLTYAFDAVGTRVSMDAYPPLYYQSHPAGEFFLRGLTFSNLWIGGPLEWLRLGSNGALWSLSYEAAYYAMFGVFMFVTGLRRWALLVVIAYVVGLPILILMPCWLLGVGVWRLIRSGTYLQLSHPTALVLAIGAPIALIALKSGGMDQLLMAITSQVTAPNHPQVALYYSDEVLWNTLLALGVAAHLLGMARLLNGDQVDETARTARTIRWVAGGSFSLYVVHYPTLHLLDAILPEGMPGYDATMLGIVLLVCFAFAALFERPLKLYRNVIGHVFRSDGAGMPRRVPNQRTL